MPVAAVANLIDSLVINHKKNFEQMIKGKENIEEKKSGFRRHRRMFS